MKRVRLLDCTLRDGGFINDWNFGERSILSLYNGLLKTGVDILELGYIRRLARYDRNRTVFSSTQDARWLLESADAAGTMRVMILDYGQCDPEQILPRTERDVEGIRVTFKKKDIKAALEMCAQIKSKGYCVFAQPVSIMDYTDMELLELLDELTALHPYAVSIVDTYGFMQQDDVLHLYGLFDRHLPKDVVIGYHAHNNFQLAYSNAVALIEHYTQRCVVIDASLYGMGKSAGNASLELLMNYCNVQDEDRYDLSVAIELIDTEISKYQQGGNWGYSLLYYLAAAYRCHPEYVKFLIQKRTLAVGSAVRLLQDIPQPIRTSFNREYIEQAYLAAQTQTQWDDEQVYQVLKGAIGGRPVLIVAPGGSIRTCYGDICACIEREAPFVVHINGRHCGLPADALFFKNEKRYLNYHAGNEGREICFLASNMPREGQEAGTTFCIGNAVQDPDAVDNTTLVLLHILRKAGQKNVLIAGMDGFRPGQENFMDPYHSLGNDPALYEEINRKARRCLEQLGKELTIRFITPSLYSPSTVQG